MPTTITNAVRFVLVSVCVCVGWLCSTLEAGFKWDNIRRNRLICQHVTSAHQIMTFRLVSAIVMPKSSLFGSSKVNLGCVGLFVFSIMALSVISVFAFTHAHTSHSSHWTTSEYENQRYQQWTRRKCIETEYVTTITIKTILQSGVIARVQAARAQNLGPLFQRSPQCNYYPSMLCYSCCHYCCHNFL